MKNINILYAKFIGAVQDIDVQITTIVNYFAHHKNPIIKKNDFFYQVGEEEGIHGMKEVIYNLQYKYWINIEQFLNYHNENDIVMESPTDEKD